MALSIVATDAKATAAPANAFTSNSINTTGASLVVVSMDYNNPSVATVSFSDNKGNSWTKIGTETFNTTGGVGGIWAYAKNATVGAGHTFTVTLGGGNSADMDIVVIAIGGADATAPLDTNVTNQTGNSATILSGQNITLATANEMVVCWGTTVNSHATPWPVGSGYTIQGNVTFHGQQSQIFASSGSKSAAWGSFGVTDQWVGGAAAFKAAASSITAGEMMAARQMGTIDSPRERIEVVGY